MMKLLKILPCMAVLLLCASCSVKEDRRECPCYLELVPDSRMAGGESAFGENGNILVSVFDGSKSASYRNIFQYSQIEEEDYGQIALRRGFVDVNALWSSGYGVVRGHVHSIPLGRQMDSLYSSTARSVDATGEVAVAMIFDAKQFCTITIRMLAAEDDFPFDLVVMGDVSGTDLIGLTPVHGGFMAVPEPSVTGDGSCSVRVPRQDDGSLMLEFWEKGSTKASGSQPVSAAAIGEYILAAGYDWNEESLQDVDVTVDFAHASISVSVDGWELTWAYSIEI